MCREIPANLGDMDPRLDFSVQNKAIGLHNEFLLVPRVSFSGSVANPEALIGNNERNVTQNCHVYVIRSPSFKFTTLAECSVCCSPCRF